MEVNFAFLCDYADQSGGKMTAVGIGIDTIYAAKVPVKHYLLYAVISIKFSATEVGPKQVGMHLIDADGKSVIPPLDTTINIGSPPPGILYRNQNIMLTMRGVTFQDYGEYTVSWLLGGQEIKSVPLRVAPPPAPPSTA